MGNNSHTDIVESLIYEIEKTTWGILLKDKSKPYVMKFIRDERLDGES